MRPSPAHAQVVRADHSLALVVQPFERLERLQQGDERIVGVVKHKMLTACQRCCRRPCHVEEPMRKVEGDVLLARLRGAKASAHLLHRLFEGPEELPGRRLHLHEPVAVELHLLLCKEEQTLRDNRQALERWQEIRVVRHHVGEREVVIADLLAVLVAADGSVAWLHGGEQPLHLHNVVHCRQDEHGLDALLRHHDRAVRAALPEA
mmetsp:Transcript_14117/g.38830  ORF Transcript_14117/g.38830 Transcript_14117/m.38830 type:complete len:206 (+) Transcript_14117:870-1487(+)